jgi:hypothetical protein
MHRRWGNPEGKLEITIFYKLGKFSSLCFYFSGFSLLDRTHQGPRQITKMGIVFFLLGSILVSAEI